MLTVDLSGKRALVTGASSGLGAHFAKVLAGAGAHVLVAARRVALLDELVAQIHRTGGSASAVPFDVNDNQSITAGIAAAGVVDILVNNAGVSNGKPALEQTEADYDRIVNTNQKGAFLVAITTARAMRDRSTPGTIINIASILGFRQGAAVTPYAMSKAAVVQMTRQLALELARFKIRVNALAPGYFATEINEDFLKSAPGQAMVQRIPQRRLGEPADLDGPLLLLASDASQYMTGSVITVDGGHLTSGL